MAELLHVISIWWDGQSTLSETLWGLSMLWWGRIGKLTTYFATLVIILDFVGAARVRALGSGAGRAYARFKHWTSPSAEKKTDPPLKFKIKFIASFLVLCALGYLLFAQLTDGWRLALIPLVALLAVYLWKYLLLHIAGLVAMAVAMPVLISIALFLDIGKFLTWAMHKALGGDGYAHPVRVGAFVVGSLGFFMDLLAT